jgi:hypothetical protein
MRILHFSALLIFLGMYLVVKIPGGILWLKPLLPDLYGMGDLYRFSYLSAYRDSSVHNPPPPPEPETETCLFVLGDSFAGPLNKEHFPGIKYYSFVNWNQFPSSRISLKTNKKYRNLLLIECSEKHIQLRFSNEEFRRFLTPTSTTSAPGFQVEEKNTGFKGSLEAWAGRPQVTDQNLHMLLFSNELVLKMKESKAAFNQKVFGRIASEVEEYPEKNMLLQRMTTDTEYLYMSSFRPLNKKRENDIIRNMKAMVSHFKSIGVDTVVFSFIPNPVSVIAPGYKGRTYNRLIPVLESRMAETGAGCISVFSAFSKKKESVYRRGDTHWNAAGEKIWLNNAVRWVQHQPKPNPSLSPNE